MDVASPMIIDMFAAAASAVGVTPPPTGDMAAEAARFAQLLEPGAPAAPGEIGSVGAAPAVGGVDGAVPPVRSLGDAIIGGLGSMGDSYQQTSAEFLAAMKPFGASGVEGATPAGLIRMQGAVSSWSLHVEVLSSCGKQATSTFNDLTKLQ